MLKINKTAKFVSLIVTCIAASTATLSIAHDNKPTIVVSDSHNKTLGTNPKADLMIQAINYNDIEQVKALVNNGVGINENLAGDGTPLIIAVQRNKKAIIQALIELGADVDFATHIDANALINAAMTNNVEVAQLLLNHGATIDAIVVNDETALITASRAGHYDTVKFLVENGADVNLGVNVTLLNGTEYRSPLNGAKTHKIKQYLIDNGAKA